MDKLSSAWVYVVKAQGSNWANVNPQVSKFERAQCCNQKKYEITTSDLSDPSPIINFK